MIELRLDVDDLADTRFAISPLLEAVLSLRIWHFPGYYVLQLPWLRSARRDLGDLDIGLLLALVGLRQRALPDFLAPRPHDPVPDFAAELERAATTPPSKVAADVVAAHAGLPLPPMLESLLARPARLRDQIVELLTAYWQLVIAPHWPRMRGALEADLLYRAQRLAYGGARLLFADLNPNLRWSGGVLRLDMPVPHRDDLIPVTGRGLCLMPTLFVNTPYPPVGRDEPPMVAYPARGIAAVWEDAAPPAPDALAALVGRAKAAVLTCLDRPTSTSDLARRLGVTPGAVSQHLAVLHATGLVGRTRAGRVVLYALTDLGARLRTGEPA